MKILVRVPNWLGDLVMATPGLIVLRDRFRDAEISVLGIAGVIHALEGHPAVDRILAYDRSGADRGIQGLRNMARSLRDERFDVTYVFPNSFASAFSVWLAGIPVRIGFATDGRSALLTEAPAKAPYLAHCHQSEVYATLAAGGSLESVPHPQWAVGVDERREAESLLRQSGLERDRPLLALNPGSVNGLAKRWPVERYARVVRWAVESAGWEVVILGAGSDRDVCENVATLARVPVVTLAGCTGIRQFMSILTIAEICLSNDSGGMHVAAALGRPQVSLFGPTDSWTTGPFGPRQVVLRKPVACSPCLDRVCGEGHHACMERITVDEVTSVLWSMVENPDSLAVT